MEAEDDIKIEVSSDFMQVYLTLVPMENHEYSSDEIIQFLKISGIKMGIDNEAINGIINNHLYNRKVLVASGVEAHNGEDGRIEYRFEEKDLGKPKILDDGSADFTDMQLFVPVKKGDLIAEYIPPTKGQFGYNVYGTLIKPKNGKPVPAMHGKGFEVSSDGTKYYSILDGRVDCKYGQLEVSNVYEHKGDLDSTAGNIKFEGDVIVRGDVRSGMIIQATGNVEVSGHVGASIIISDSDIVLRNGMQGKGRGVLQAKGNISGKFFEDTKIRSEGDIVANYILNCDVYTRGTVNVKGRVGSIVGGMVHGVRGIVSQNAGNDAFKPTIIKTGAGDEMLKGYADANLKFSDLEREITALESGLERLNSMGLENMNEEAKDAYNKLFQNKILKITEKKHLDELKRDLMQKISEATKSEITIENVLYSGVSVHIGTETKNFTTTGKAIKIRQNNGNIEVSGIY